jgi:hypothetical protein
LTFTWKPALFKASTKSVALKSPVTSAVVTFALAVSPVTPFTSLIASRNDFTQPPHELWKPVMVRDFTVSGLMPLSLLNPNSLMLPVSPWKPPRPVRPAPLGPPSHPRP